MGNTDSVPVISQVKSTVQLVCGDLDGAAKTQENFWHECPGASQLTSGVYLLQGKGEKALETQKRCGKGILNLADGIPVVGHAKGLIHYAVGDEEGGDKAMKSATRTTGVIGGGVVGFCVGGPVGAVAGGISGGAITDVGTTIVTGQESGYVAAIHNAVKNPNPGDIFDLCLMPVSDGLAGHSAGSIVRRLTTPKGPAVMQGQVDLAKAGELRAQAVSIYEAAEANKLSVPEIQTLTEMNKVSKLWQAADALEGKVAAANPKVITSSAKMLKPVDLKAAAAAPQKARSDESQEERKRQKTLRQRQLQQPQRIHQRQQQHQTQRQTARKDSESDSDQECTCQDICIPIVYSNMRSINPCNASLQQKIRRLTELIARNRPVVVAIVETWLRDSHNEVQVSDRLGLQGYQIWRQDRDAGHPDGNAYDDRKTGLEGRRGGGILIAWRPDQLTNGTILNLVRNTCEDYGDNIMSVDIHVNFNCLECNDNMTKKKFGFSVVYRRPKNDAIDQEVRNRLIHLTAAYEDNLNGYNGWSFVGDFNLRGGRDDKRFQELLCLAPDGTTVFPDSSTRTHIEGGCLDLVLASEGHVDGVLVSPEPISDHHAIIFKLNLGTDYPQNEECQECNQ